METACRFTGPLTYSPDGRSLACGFETTMMIWDIQTGGVVKEIPCGFDTASLAWSLDGRVIGAINYSHRDTSNAGTHVNIYDVASSTPLFTRDIYSNSKPHLWAHEESFRIMTTKRYFHGPTKPIQIDVKVSEVRSCPFEVQVFHITTAVKDTDYTLGSEVVSFSLTTCHVAVLVGSMLRVFQDPYPAPLFREDGRFLSQCFSSDGRLFVAFEEHDVHVWEHISGSYTNQKKFWCPGRITSPQISPNLSSILSHSKNVLQVWRLESPPIYPKSHDNKHITLSPSGSCIAISSHDERRVTIASPQWLFPCHIIDTPQLIKGLLITGNVLLLVGSEQVMAWLVTAEGLVSGTVGNNNRIWAVSYSPPESKLTLHVDGQIGVIERDGIRLCLYHAATGEVIQSTQTNLRLGNPGHDLKDSLCGRHYLYYQDLSQHGTPPEGGWYPSETALREGWVKDPEGRHRLWLHAGWSRSWDVADWCYDITTYFSAV